MRRPGQSDLIKSFEPGHAAWKAAVIYGNSFLQKSFRGIENATLHAFHQRFCKGL